jgi:hypothetical protein
MRLAKLLNLQFLEEILEAHPLLKVINWLLLQFELFKMISDPTLGLLLSLTIILIFA